MIPKIIHYFWFGNNPLSEKAKKCVESWTKMCPDYEIILWNEQNYDFHKNKFMENAAKAGKWSFVTDYARLDIIYEYGGIYLDTDVELIKPIDDFLKFKAFFGFETTEHINTGLGFGAEKGCEGLKKMMEIYERLPELSVEQYAEYYCPKIQSPVLKEMGIKLDGSKQMLEGILILPKEYLCPLDYDTGKLNITKNTYGIHWFEASWKSEEERNIKELWRKLTPVFGKKNAGHIAVLIGYPKYYSIKKTIKYYMAKLRKI